MKSLARSSISITRRLYLVVSVISEDVVEIYEGVFSLISDVDLAHMSCVACKDLRTYIGISIYYNMIYIYYIADYI